MIAHKGWWLRRAFVCYCIYNLYRLLKQRRKWLEFRKQTAAIGMPTPPLKESLRSTFLGHNYELLVNFNTAYDWRSNTILGTAPTVSWKTPIFDPEPMVSTVDPAVIKHILKDNYNNYIKGVVLQNALMDLLGRGIFIVNHGQHADDKGKAWLFQRKTASKVFTRNAFKHKVHDTFVRNTGRLCKRLDTHIKSNETLDMQDAFFKFTMDTIGDIGFGVELDTLSKGFVPFADAFDR